MNLSLPENISALRKEHEMTQEQLAEALGVSFAAVSKWERGIATPELNLITEMADLFEVSIDALIGYRFRNNDREAVIARLKQYFHESGSGDIFADVEKALKRYPNCFEVVYRSARLYQMRGFARSDTAYARRALNLYRQACLLIGQNTDPEISEVSIRREMAEAHFTLGEYGAGIELLKKYDPCRCNHAIIGQILAADCGDPKGALPYLSMALLDLTQTHMEIVVGYLNVYCRTGAYEDALALMDWALAFYPGLRSPQKRTYLDKCEAVLRAERAEILLALDRKEEAARDLRKARELAARFDEAPNYDAASIRFVACREPATAYDDLGDTAMQGLVNVIAQSGKEELLELWREIGEEACMDS